MTKEWMVRKLTSRKFWVGVAGIASGLYLIITGDENTAQQISGAIIECVSIWSYIKGEAIADSKRVGGSDV